MKAPIAQAGGEATSPPGCAFIFFWGLETVKFIKKNSDFGGPTEFQNRGILHEHALEFNPSKLEVE